MSERREELETGGEREKEVNGVGGGKFSKIPRVYKHNTINFSA